MQEQKKLISYDYLYFDELTSTNDYGKSHYQEFLKPTVILTKNQTAGRGRNTHKWISDEGSLTMSIVINNDFKKLNEDFLLKVTSIVGIALNKVLNKTFKNKHKVMLKWPNDQLVDAKKIAGILVEGKSKKEVTEAIIIGIGVNVNTPIKEKIIEGDNVITSIKALTGETLNINIFSHIIATAVLEAISNYDVEIDVDYLNEKNYLWNKKVTFMAGGILHQGTVLRITNEGFLEVRENNNTYVVKAGEVSLLRERTKN